MTNRQENMFFALIMATMFTILWAHYPDSIAVKTMWAVNIGWALILKVRSDGKD